MRRLSVALIDSGIGAGQEVSPRRFCSLVDRRDAVDRLGHGTAILDTLSWYLPLDRLDLDLVKLFDDRLTASPDQLREAFTWLLASPPDWLLCSFGLPTPRAELHAIVRRLRAAGTRIVASSPRFGVPVYPAAWPEVQAVTGGAGCLPGPPRRLPDGRWLACVWAARPGDWQPWQVGPPPPDQAGAPPLGGASFAAAQALGFWLSREGASGGEPRPVSMLGPPLA